MRTLRGQILAEAVVNYFEANNRDQAATANYFFQQNVIKRVTRNIIQRYRDSGTATYKKNTGRKRTVCDEITVNKVKEFFHKNPRCSVRDAAARFNMALSTMARCRKIAGIKSLVRQKAPIYNSSQLDRCTKAASLLLKKTDPRFTNKIIIMDDETYCYKNPDQTSGKSYYSTSSDVELPESVRYKGSAKFAGKYLVWQAISSNGRASPCHISTGTMNGKSYLAVLKKYLIPWIRSNFKSEEVIFWPDLATCHYTNDVIQFLKSQNIETVSKCENAPNLPQARPIEKYWALVKREYRRYHDNSKSLASFSKRWHLCSKKVMEMSGKALFENLREKLKIVKKFGPRPSIRINSVVALQSIQNKTV